MTINNPQSRQCRDEPHKRELTEDLVFVQYGPSGGENSYVVPSGFRSDGATTWPFHWLIPAFGGRWELGTFVHDYLCEQWESGVCRFDADNAMFTVNRECGLDPWRNVSMWLAVRLWAIVWLLDFRPCSWWRYTPQGFVWRRLKGMR